MVKKKPARNRRHVPRPDLRAALLDAAETLVRDEGYAAATARRIAEKVGLKHQSVFYYFESQEDLLLALLRRTSEAYRDRLVKALNSDRPLSAMWEVERDPAGTRLTLEFMALANHNEAIRAEIARNARAFRELEAAATAKYLDAHGIKPLISPMMVSILTNAMARLLVQEDALGIDVGHLEAQTLANESFQSFEASGKTISTMQPLVEAAAKLKK